MAEKKTVLNKKQTRALLDLLRTKFVDNAQLSVDKSLPQLQLEIENELGFKIATSRFKEELDAIGLVWQNLPKRKLNIKDVIALEDRCKAIESKLSGLSTAVNNLRNVAQSKN